MLHVHSKHAQSRCHNGWTDDQPEQAESIQPAKNADEQEQIVQPGAIAQKQRTNEIVSHSRHAASESAVRSFSRVNPCARAN